MIVTLIIDRRAREIIVTMLTLDYWQEYRIRKDCQITLNGQEAYKMIVIFHLLTEVFESGHITVFDKRPRDVGVTLQLLMKGLVKSGCHIAIIERPRKVVVSGDYGCRCSKASNLLFWHTNLHNCSTKRSKHNSCSNSCSSRHQDWPLHPRVLVLLLSTPQGVQPFYLEIRPRYSAV